MSVSKIRKRDGSVVDFDNQKVAEAVFKAAQSVGGNDKTEAERVANRVHELLNAKYTEKIQ